MVTRTEGPTQAVLRRQRPRHWAHVGKAGRHAVLLMFSALALFPLYYMVVSALKTNTDFAGNQIGVPTRPVLSTLHAALVDGDLGRWFANSVLITTTSVLISTALAA